MRILIVVLVIAFAGAAWWGLHEAPRPPAAEAPAPAPAPVASAPAPIGSGAIVLSPIQFSAKPADSYPAATGGAGPAAPPAFSVVGAVALPGQKPALTLRIGGELRTVREGEMIDTYRVERIDRDRVVLLHVESGSRVERMYADAVSPGSAPVVASAPTGGPFAPPAPSAGAASPTPTPAPAPPVNYVAPRAPAGATVNDNPLVGAIIPTAPGQAPPGMTGPRPIPLRPGQPPPPGPVPMPVPPNAQGPAPR